MNSSMVITGVRFLTMSKGKKSAKLCAFWCPSPVGEQRKESMGEKIIDKLTSERKAWDRVGLSRRQDMKKMGDPTWWASDGNGLAVQCSSLAHSLTHSLPTSSHVDGATAAHYFFYRSPNGVCLGVCVCVSARAKEIVRQRQAGMYMPLESPTSFAK